MKVERNGQIYEIVAITDLDGTANDETVSESRRISTISPAKEAYRRLEEVGISVGISTARSAGEGELYAAALAISGIHIAEDGGVLVLPKDQKDKATIGLNSNFPTVNHQEWRVLLLSKVGIDKIREFFELVEREAKLLDPERYLPMVSSVLSTMEDLKTAAGHYSLDLTRLSADRLASAYTFATDVHLRVMAEHAERFGIRHFRRNPKDPVMIFGADAHKGNALLALNSHAADFYGPDVAGIMPIVFGNSSNDIPLFEEAIRLGGKTVLVAHPDKNVGYAVNRSLVPEGTIFTKGPYGYGVLEAIPQILNRLDIKPR